MTAVATPAKDQSVRGKRGLRMRAKPLIRDLPVTLVIDIGQTELRKKDVLPFLPRPADQLAVGPGANYLCVDEVFWDPIEGIQVWFQRPERSLTESRFLDDGWLTWDEFQEEHL